MSRILTTMKGEKNRYTFGEMYLEIKFSTCITIFDPAIPLPNSPLRKKISHIHANAYALQVVFYNSRNIGKI